MQRLDLMDRAVQGLRKNEVIVWEGFTLVQPTEGMVLYVNIWKCDDVSLLPPLPWSHCEHKRAISVRYSPYGFGVEEAGRSQPQEGESVNTPLILSTLGIALFNGVKTII
jgi:hypothetical protein